MADNSGIIIADVPAAEGVRKVFGAPDGTIPGLLNSLVGNYINLVTPRHETTAIHIPYRPVLDTSRLKQEFGYAPEEISRAAFEVFTEARRG